MRSLREVFSEWDGARRLTPREAAADFDAVLARIAGPRAVGRRRLLAAGMAAVALVMSVWMRPEGPPGDAASSEIYIRFVDEPEEDAMHIRVEVQP